MERSEFLREVSSLSREEIEKKIKPEDRIRKLYWPAVYIRRRNDEKEVKKDVKPRANADRVNAPCCGHLVRFNPL